MNFIDKKKERIKRKEMGLLTKTVFIKKILYEKPFPIKIHFNPVIPLNIFQTWHTKLLPPNMAKSVTKIKKLNPRFNYHLFDDNDCENFISKYFKPDVLYSYKKLLPGAYKADLWRYCVLYIYGGIYLDIKYKPHHNFRFINLMESDHFCLDIDGNNIYNAVMVCNKGNNSCFKAIRQIVTHVANKFYGNSCLDITGPGLLANCLLQSDKQFIDLRHTVLENFNNRYVIYKGFCILKQYDGYLEECGKHSKTPHYSALWNEKRVYN